MEYSFTCYDRTSRIYGICIGSKSHCERRLNKAHSQTHAFEKRALNGKFMSLCLPVDTGCSERTETHAMCVYYFNALLFFFVLQ